MQLEIKINTAALNAALDKAAGQVPYAVMLALNKTAEQAKSEVVSEMTKVFDRPTPWTLNSLRIKYATKTKPVAELAYKDKNSAETSRTMIEPHVNSGKRHYKGMEARLLGIGLLPSGWNVVPGEAAKLDGYGNMSAGQITQLLNVLGTYTESGFNKANINTVKRLAKGNAKKGVYGFTYFVNPVGGKNRHIPPGVYQRVKTAYGTSLKPILIFVKRVSYKQRLDFYGIVQRVAKRDLDDNFRESFEQALRGALLKSQGSLL